MVGGLGVTHHGVEVQPLGYLGPAGEGDVQLGVLSGLYGSLLIQPGSCTADGYLVGTTLNCNIVLM